MRIWRCHLGSLLRKSLFGTVVLTIVTYLLLLYQTPKHNRHSAKHAVEPFTTGKCHNPRDLDSIKDLNSAKYPLEYKNTTTRLYEGGNVLVFYRETSITFRLHIVTILEASRVNYKLVYVSQKTSLPPLTENGAPLYHVIVFENLKFYLGLPEKSREIFDKYLRDFSAGLAIFTIAENYGFLPNYFPKLHLKIRTGISSVKTAEVNPKSSLLRLTRAGGVVDDNLPGKDWATFSSNHSTYEPVETISREIFKPQILKDPVNSRLDYAQSYITKRYVSVILDKGKLDGIKKVYFGNGLNFWLHRLLFIDGLDFLSDGAIKRPLDRWILVDIDDIFVGKTGIRMTRDDVQAMISVQQSISERVPGFKFNLGFSGFYYLHGNKQESGGDQELIANADKFWWFSHMYSHRKPHRIATLETMRTELMQNLDFAKRYGIPLNTSYAVAPHHSGVYPTHDLLYDSWKRYYGLTVTSTEEYPHFNPPHHRRGFIYKGIKVLPRQTCGLYTKTIRLKEYPKGPKRLEHSIYGGELFQTVINNPINIYMTHMSNYGSDRLALHTFENVIKYLQCWTNLRIQTEHPVALADRYFDMYPAEKEPLWQNPCKDKRHLYILADEKKCRRLPSVLIVGPQKTGTTALYMFLLMHPDLVSNEQSVKTYEEVQFFNGYNYLRGLDWYLDFFPDVNNSSNAVLFEKSANYFDSPKTPRRAHSLLPNAKIIVILVDPVKRAYSWYQHVRSHGSKAAIQNSFYDIITGANGSAGQEAILLGQRSLQPGLYAYHLERWLQHYPAPQILVIDGEVLKADPADVMLEVQQFLGTNIFDYNAKLRFDKRKGFYCQITSRGKSKCLGRGKGRRYPPIDQRSREFLENYYRDPNKHLIALLRRLGKPLPQWLAQKYREV
ncbi:bifunctional heparan sulfate N-deacetylase/N-sulfotransferase 4 [Nematostella vectensis]|uniref:bifunctional heparan sulfate N-deacetylase/N-sulfotransferase 4 n=1 Tax=Nematostella vectensis TaxID=45351 RepID=UPI00207734EF|nr:bifunctional heparan sulfate N-deacetylase/N-sulfotransferase 4 [Nematostella vectensis]